MTRKVLKSNSHGNNLEVFEHGESIDKIAMNEKGNAAIQREKQGYDWFGIKTIAEKNPENNCDFIHIPKFRGKKFPQYNGISGNEMWIKKLIEFYKVKWNEGKFAVHGDLALCNIIFGGEGKVYIVDWEHFHYASKEFFGFDIFNMLFILLQYEYRWLQWGWNWVSLIRTRHRLFIKDCYDLLPDSGFMRTPFTNSHWYINKYMNRDKFILGKQKGNILESLDWMCNWGA